VTAAASGVPPPLAPLWKELYEGAKEDLVAAMGRHRFLLWFRDAEVERVSGRQVTLAVPTEVHRTWLEFNYRGLLEASFSRMLGAGTTVDFRVSEVQEGKRRIRERLPEDERAWRRLVEAHAPAPTLPGWVGDDAGRFVVQLLSQVVHGNADAAPPSIYLYGETGTGKSHLLTALARAVGAQTPGGALYLTARTFTSRFVAAVRTREVGAVQEFEADVATRRVVLVDGIDELESRSATQHELDVLLDRADRTGVRFVLAGRRHPRDVEGLSDRLRSRLLGGVVHRLAVPSRPRLALVLEARARGFGTALPEDVLAAILERTQGVHSAVDLLDRWAAVSAQEGAPVGVEWLSEMAPSQPPAGAREEVVRRAKDLVAEHYGVRRACLDRPTKQASAVLPRRVAMYLVYRAAALPLLELGKAFGLRSHSSVSRAIREIRAARDRDPSIEVVVDGLLARL
jgi:chromosomal replication initiator protein DnaA